MEPSKKFNRAITILENVKFWLSNGDSKVSFIIGFTGVFLGFIFASDSITKSIQTYIKTIGNMSIKDMKMIISLIAALLFVISIFLIAKSVYHLLQALQAKVDPEVYQQPGLETNSSIFWGTIAKCDYSTFKKSFDDNEEKHLNDVQSQAYLNSVICKEKFDEYNNGLISLRRGILVFIIFKLLTYFPI
jgi:hypothetical protein